MSQGRIERRFARLREEGRKALLAYIVAGDPHLSATLPAMQALARAGVDVIELGLPFTDPEAEGPVIQAAHERALRNQVSLTRVLDLIAEFRQQGHETPVILMGYLNPLERMGYQAFAKRAQVSQLDGALIVNLPPEESGLLREAMSEQGLDLIHLLAPTSSDERVARIGATATGFVYYVSLTGVTGAGHLDVQAVASRLSSIRGHLSRLPLVVGFGVKDGRSAAALAPLADGVVVGSVIVDLFDRYQDSLDELFEAVQSLASQFRKALDTAP